MKNIFYFFAVFLIFSCIVNGGQDTLQSEIVTAIKEQADYAYKILIDTDGKSRCEYSLTEGRWYPYEEPWHTGQLINALLEAHSIIKNDQYLIAAKKAGDWWCSLLITDNPKLNGMVKAIHGNGIDNIIFATVSDGTPGLFNLWRRTGIKKYAEVPSGAGKWMFENMYEPGSRLFYDAVDYKTGEVLKTKSPFWPGNKEYTLTDVARPNNEGFLFKDMFEYTQDSRYKNLFIDLCNSLVEKQGEEGLWMQFTPNDKESGLIHPRFNLWNAESLIEGYVLSGDKKYLMAAKKTLMYYVTLQKKDGTMYYNNYIDGHFSDNSVCGSAVAFAGLLWIRLVEYGVGDEFKANIEKSLHWVLSNRFSKNHPDMNLQGALINTKTRNKNGKILIMQRDVGTSFGIRFLSAYLKYHKL